MPCEKLLYDFETRIKTHKQSYLNAVVSGDRSAAVHTVVSERFKENDLRSFVHRHAWVRIPPTVRAFCSFLRAGVI